MTNIQSNYHGTKQQPKNKCRILNRKLLDLFSTLKQIQNQFYVKINQNF